jgi:hypothetical protein
MLNLFKLNSKINNKINIHSLKKTPKQFPVATREWKDSIYVYNKYSLSLIPSLSNSVIKLIKSYFNIFNNIIERKMRTRRLLLRFRRLSSNRIYISNGEFKHTNNKVIITLYLFNRQKTNYLLTLNKWYLNIFFSKNIKLGDVKKNMNFNSLILERLTTINVKGLQALKKANENKYSVIESLDLKDKNYNSVSEYLDKFYKKLISKSLRKLELYFYYRQLILINKFKLNYNYLQYLKEILQNIYNKNIEFNLINLKRFYLNSDIISESIALKITRNRRNILKLLNKIKNKVRIQKKKVFLGESLHKKVYLNIKKNMNDKNIINNLKYRHTTGFRLETNGRLTRRFTASRSVSKVRYKGNLLEIDSSYRGLSSVLLKGNIKSNVQYTKINSKSRIGSFGVKGWTSGN